MTRRDARPRQRLDPEQRRSAILQAAESAFRENGWSGATLGEIAQRAEGSEALIYRYFPGKDQLYAELVQRSVDDLQQARTAAVDALPPNTSTRDRIRAALMVHLDRAAAHPEPWANPFGVPTNEPDVVAPIRAAARAEFADQLREWLPQHTVRHGFAVDGFLGFIDAASSSWVQRGCPSDDHGPLLDAALGALQGALGDWGS